MPDLGKTFDEISAYAKSQGLHVFHGVPLIGEEPQGVMLWDENDKNWRDFIEVGLAEGVKTLVATKEYGEGKHSGEVGSITLAWSKDGIIYLFSQAEPWFEEE